MIAGKCAIFSAIVTFGIAIVGAACRFPDASSPEALWEAALAGRRAFRRVPAERLRLDDYAAADADADGIYVREAAVIEGYHFDRVTSTGPPILRTGWRSTSRAPRCATPAVPTAPDCRGNAPVC